MGTQFLVLPFSPKELSLGSHATLSGLSPINPALFSSFKDRPEFSINRGVWFGDIATAQVGYNLAKNNRINHLGVKYLGVTDLEFRGNVPQDNALAKFSSFGLVLDAGASFIQNKQKFGISLSYIHFGLYTEESKGLGLNLGYIYNLKNNIKIGLALQNLGKMTTLLSTSPTLPKRFFAGVSKELIYKNYINNIYGSIELNSIRTTNKFYIGNSFSWNRLNIYTGYSFAKEISEASIGFGLKMNQYAINYGVRFGSQDLGIPKIISLRVLLP